MKQMFISEYRYQVLMVMWTFAEIGTSSRLFCPNIPELCKTFGGYDDLRLSDLSVGTFHQQMYKYINYVCSSSVEKNFAFLMCTQQCTDVWKLKPLCNHYYLIVLVIYYFTPMWFSQD